MLSDRRRIRLYRINTQNGEMSSDFSGDIWESEDGGLETSGLWSGLVPFSPEDVEIQAKRLGITSLEWMRRRLLCVAGVRIELVD